MLHRLATFRSQVALRVALGAMLPGTALTLFAIAAEAGHEVPYYPSFYPQEIRIEPLDPKRAAQEFSSKTDPLHVYIGGAPQFGGDSPKHLKFVESLASFIVAEVNPLSRQARDRKESCALIERAVSNLNLPPDIHLQSYPITPYHADFLHHVDRLPAGDHNAKASAVTAVTYRGDTSAQGLLAGRPTDLINWDVGLEEIAPADLLARAGVAFNGWQAPPWAKEGWFQAYHLLRNGLDNPASRERVDDAYGRLIGRDFDNLADRINLERELVQLLTSECKRLVVGYRVRRDYYNDDFSNGIENIAVDSQFGLNSPIFLRVVKLKDFPWNGWLRVGVPDRGKAAWNPIGGFNDEMGRLVWSVVGDPAFLPITYNSQWATNRTEVMPAKAEPKGQSIRVPADAIMPAESGRLAPIGRVAGATTKVTYRVFASAFQDGTEMEAADMYFPYALAFRWGANPAQAAYDPEIAAATTLIRERLRGVRIVRIEETTLPLADLTFKYRNPIVELYLESLSSDDAENGVLAPPWSAVPWHVLALMEAAVERGIAAFSKTEADRRKVPWLDLVRDPAQRAKLVALIKEFAASGYRPAALEGLVTPEAARARWRALDRFVAEKGHLLVTNGPYVLKSWSPDSVVFDVIRDFTYPIGLGAFNAYAYPPRSVITKIEHKGNRIDVWTDVEMEIKEQRNRRAVRMPLKRNTLRETYAIRPMPRYLITSDDGRVAAAGTARWQDDGSFAVTIPPNLTPGRYRFVAAMQLDGNTIRPDLGRVDLEIK